MNFSLITKLGRKHVKCSVVIVNHPPEYMTPTFDSIAWNYDHAAPYTYVITTHTLTTTRSIYYPTNTVISTMTHYTARASDDR